MTCRELQFTREMPNNDEHSKQHVEERCLGEEPIARTPQFFSSAHSGEGVLEPPNNISLPIMNVEKKFGSF